MEADAAGRGGQSNKETPQANRLITVKHQLGTIAQQFEELHNEHMALVAENQQLQRALASLSGFQKEMQGTMDNINEERKSWADEKRKLLDDAQATKGKLRDMEKLEDENKSLVDEKHKLCEEKEAALEEKRVAMAEKQRFELAVEASHKALDAMEEKLRECSGGDAAPNNTTGPVVVSSLDPGALFAAVDREEAAARTLEATAGVEKKAAQTSERAKRRNSSSSSSPSAKSGRQGRSKRRSRSGRRSRSRSQRTKGKTVPGKFAAKARQQTPPSSGNAAATPHAQSPPLPPQQQAPATGPWMMPQPAQGVWYPPQGMHPAVPGGWGAPAPGILAPPAPGMHSPGSWGQQPQGMPGAGGWGQSAPPSGWVGPRA